MLPLALAFAAGFALAWTIRPIQLLASFARHARWIGPLWVGIGACIIHAIAFSATAADPGGATWRVTVRRGGISEMGTGTAINKNWAVSCWHVTQSAKVQGIVELTHGEQSLKGEVVSMDPDADLSLIYVNAGFPSWVDVAEADPQPGEAVSIFGYGHAGTLRSGYGTLAKAAGRRGGTSVPVLESTLQIESGDSGCGLFNSKNELAGVNWGANGGPSGGIIVGYSQSTPASFVRTVAAKYEAQCWGPYCPIIPQRRPAQPYAGPQRPGGGTLVPVTPSTQPPAAQQPQQPAGKPCECDPAALDQRLTAIEKQIASLATTPSARPCTCDPAAQQAAMEKAIKDAIAGIKFPDAPPAPSEEVTHFVVVADSAAPDSRRLNEYVGKAKETYSGIKTADLPKYPIGPVPQLVEFRGAQAVRVVKGKQAVEERLYRIARGEYPAQ